MRWLTILASFLAIAVTAAAQSARAPEYEVKAAFLYNFAKFVEWPPQAFAYSSTPIRFCVLGDDAFADTLSRSTAEYLVRSCAAVCFGYFFLCSQIFSIRKTYTFNKRNPHVDAYTDPASAHWLRKPPTPTP